MSNISTKINLHRVFQGPAVVYLGASGATPTEVGGVFNVSIDIGIETERFVQGWPRTLKELYVKAKSCKVKFDTAESGDFMLMRYALGSCAEAEFTIGSDECIALSFGDQSTLNKCSIKLKIVNVEGVTEEFDIWTAIGGQDGVSIAMADEGLHTPSYTFEALRTDTDWASNSTINGTNPITSRPYSNAQLFYAFVYGNDLGIISP